METTVRKSRCRKVKNQALLSGRLNICPVEKSLGNTNRVELSRSLTYDNYLKGLT